MRADQCVNQLLESEFSFSFCPLMNVQLVSSTPLAEIKVFSSLLTAPRRIVGQRLIALSQTIT